MAKRRPRETGTLIRLKDGRKILLPDGDVMDFGETLRQTIKAASLTQYQLNKLTGIPQSALSAFMAGRDLRLKTFQKLCGIVGLELVQNPDNAPREVEPGS